MEETPEERVARIKRTQGTIRAKTERIENTQTAARLVRELNIVQKFLRQVAAVCIWLWWNFGSPLFNSITVPFLKKFAMWYIGLWNRFAIVKDQYDQPRLSYKRGSGIVLATVACFMFAWTFVMFSVEGVYFGLTNKHETIYLSYAQEIDPANNMFSVQACENPDFESTVFCDEDTSIYFRVFPSPFHQVWSIIARGRVFFPDQVVSPVGSNWAKCEVVTYGHRFKLFVYFWDMYPVLLSARCTPLAMSGQGQG